MPTRQVHGVCAHDCPDACGFITGVEGERAVSFGGDPEHPVTRGWLCAKTQSYLDHVYHPDRLMHPMRRVGPKGSGEWQPISWQEAISEIADRWREIIDRYGPEAILPYSCSGTLGLVQMIVASGRFWNRLGASRLERAICESAADYAEEITMGTRLSPAYEEVVQSRLVILWGHNPVSAAPHAVPFLMDAQRNGTQLVVIDPRRTRTAEKADWHLAPLPDTDGALAMGLAHVIVSESLHDPDWLEANTVGWDLFRERLADYPPDRAAAVTGLAQDDIVKLARLYATTRPSLIRACAGVQRSLNGGQAVRAICALPALTGQYGTRGGGYAHSTSSTVVWQDEAINHWTDCPPPARIVSMNRLGAALTGEVDDPPIMSLFVFGANPVTSTPNSGLIVKGLLRDDLFTVVHELFMTDTATYADIVLPATSQLEQVDVLKGSGHTILSYNHPAIPPLGECKSNWELMGLLADALGFQEPWLHQSADQVIEEILAATVAEDPALKAITMERLRAEGNVPMPNAPLVPFADLKFPTPSGKIELYSRTMADAGLDPLPGRTDVQDDGGRPGLDTEQRESSLWLISAAAHYYLNSSFANHTGLLDREGTPFVEINPQDAASRGIEDGQLVVVENGRGWCQLRAVVSPSVRPGVLSSPKGRWSVLDPWQNGGGGRNVTWTAPDTLGDLAGQATFYSNRVWIHPADDFVPEESQL